MKTLADLKVGDAVWTIQTGIDFVKSKEELIILESGESYYPNGCYSFKDMYPSLFLEDILNKKVEGKFMMVSTDGLYWTTNRVIIDSYGEIFVQSGWKFAKEIETETFTKSITEITLEQIAEKFGVDVEQIKIKS
jgi:hypothetical protein